MKFIKNGIFKVANRNVVNIISNEVKSNEGAAFIKQAKANRASKLKALNADAKKTSEAIVVAEKSLKNAADEEKENLQAQIDELQLKLAAQNQATANLAEVNETQISWYDFYKTLSGQVVMHDDFGLIAAVTEDASMLSPVGYHVVECDAQAEQGQYYIGGKIYNAVDVVLSEDAATRVASKKERSAAIAKIEKAATAAAIEAQIKELAGNYQKQLGKVSNFAIAIAQIQLDFFANVAQAKKLADVQKAAAGYMPLIAEIQSKIEAGEYYTVAQAQGVEPSDMIHEALAAVTPVAKALKNQPKKSG